ncbi:MAG TPA: energy-coupling factor transporter transmembrane protein EcfT [Clostridiales bacterium]|jgi:energy-coupling factor transport system permease protein|nr:energy-coupling factor transporter transmembrane protein EcfT [Clostridiales bacterium]
MLRDITLGQYYPGTSVIHRLDPRLKIVGTFIFLISLFLVRNFIGFGIAVGFLALQIAISRVPLSFIFKGLKPVFLIILFTVVVNMFMTRGEPILQWWIISLTKEGLYRAGFMGLRLVLLIIGSSLLTLTTKPISLTDGIEKLLSPFRGVGLPAHELAMMMTIALRFIPTLLEEADKIMKAQMARGADFESGNLLQRAKSLIPLLVPLFISAFRIAQDLAMAMEARCYRGGDARTRMHAMTFSWRDAVAAICLVAFVAVIVVQSHVL